MTSLRIKVTSLSSELPKCGLQNEFLTSALSICNFFFIYLNFYVLFQINPLKNSFSSSPFHLIKKLNYYFSLIDIKISKLKLT